MNHTEILQAEQSIILEMALINDHKEELRSEYLEEHRRTLAEYEKEYNSEPHY